MTSTTTPQPFDASFPNSERYTPPKLDEDITVTVDGLPCTGQVLGRNGPRVQVRFERHGETYVRWFDSEAVSTA